MALVEKEKSPEVEKAEGRLTGMKEVDVRTGKKNNYGTQEKPLTQDEMLAQIELVEAKRKEGNELKKKWDSSNSDYEGEVEKLNDMVSQVLSNAVGVVGNDSDEYELLGGTKKSNRKHPVRKPKVTK